MCMFCRSLFVLLYFFLLTIVLFVILRFTASANPFGLKTVRVDQSLFVLWSVLQSILCPFYFGHCIVWPSLIYGFWLSHWLVSFGHCIVCPSLIYGFWLSHWLVSFGHCIVCPSLIYGFWISLWYLETCLSSSRTGTCLVHKGILTVCRKNMSIRHNKYTVNQKYSSNLMMSVLKAFVFASLRYI